MSLCVCLRRQRSARLPNKCNRTHGRFITVVPRARLQLVPPPPAGPACPQPSPAGSARPAPPPSDPNNNSTAAEQADQYHFPGTVAGNTSWAHWQLAGQDTHSLVGEDPMFVDLARRDFKLKPTSPALRAGFVEFDLSSVGPR